MTKHFYPLLLYGSVFYFGFKIYLILTDLPKIKKFNFCELRTANQVRVSPVQTKENERGIKITHKSQMPVRDIENF